MIQAESQLREAYGEDGKTIIDNCDTYIYMGGNDYDNAKAVANRLDLPVKRVLYMPVGGNWIFRRGQEPVNGKNIDLETYMPYMKYKSEQEIRDTIINTSEEPSPRRILTGRFHFLREANNDQVKAN